jgi:predicted ATPase
LPSDLLPSFSCDSLPFDDRLRQERERLHRQALDALHRLTTHSLNQADFQKAQQFARQQLALEPWREEAHRQLMQALASLGERTAALAQYETCRTILAEELGVEPAPQTAALAKQIQTAQVVGSTLRQAVETTAPQRLKIPFVGRQTEFELLVNAYQRATQHGVQLVTVQAKAGMGKTRLTEQFATWAATQGADLLYGCAFTTSAGFSYQPLTYLLRQRIERENAPEDLLSDLWLAQLTRLLPELRDRYPDLPQPTQEENDAKQHLFEAVTRLIQALAERRPLLLFIEDWHWADAASLDLMHYAAVRWSEAGLPILILLTLRQEETSASPHLQGWLTKIRHATESARLQLYELSQPETEQLVRTLLAPTSNGDGEQDTLPKFCDWLFQETDGQPLFLAETLKALAEDGLVQHNKKTGTWQLDEAKFDKRKRSGFVLYGVQEIIQGWLDRITPEAKNMLTAASVLAQSTTFDHLCRVTGLEELDAIETLDDLLAKQLLQEADNALPLPSHDPFYSFTHQKVSEVVYATASMARRRMLHRRAFQTLQAHGAPAAECANHAFQADLLAETIHYSLLAGNEALDLVVIPVALTHYQTIWELTEQKGWPETISGADKQAFFAGLGRAYELAEEWPKARETYEAMIDFARSNGATAMECLGIIRVANISLFFDQDRLQALALLQQAYAIAEQHGDHLNMAETDWSLAYFACLNDELPLALHHADRSLRIARDLGHPQLTARNLLMLSHIYIPRREWLKAESYAWEANQQYTDASQLVLANESLRTVGYSQLLNGKPREALATLEEAAAFCRHYENFWGEAELKWKLAHTHLECGHYGLAVKLAQEGIKMTRQLGIPAMLDLALVTASLIHRKIMALDAAKEMALEIVMVSAERQVYEIILEQALTELCAAYALSGDWGRAFALSQQRLQAMKDNSLAPASLYGWYETEALLRGGAEDLARTEIERVSGIIGENRRFQLPLRRSRAVLAEWDGDVAQAINHLQAALALAQKIGLPGEAWPILGELGRLYGELGEKEKAREAYGEAGVIVQRLVETIDAEGVREGFVTAVSAKEVLEKWQNS